MIEILHSRKRRCRLCDQYDFRYTLNKLQRLSILQVIPVPLEKINDSKSEGDASVHCHDENNSNGKDSDDYEIINKLLNLKKLNSGNVPQEQNSSIEYCTGKKDIHSKILGSGKYFQKLIHIPQVQTLQL